MWKNYLACIFGSTLQKSFSTHWLYSTKIKAKLCKSLETFHSEFLMPLALGMMNKLSYNSLHCTYGSQEAFLIFSAEDGSFTISTPIKILELQLLLGRQFPISSRIFLKFLFAKSFCSVVITLLKSHGKSHSVFWKRKKAKNKTWKRHFHWIRSTHTDSSLLNHNTTTPEQRLATLVFF